MREPLGRRGIEEQKQKILKLSLYMLLDVKVMQSKVLRLYSQAKERRKSVSIVLHGALAMEVSITPKGSIVKQIVP